MQKKGKLWMADWRENGERKRKGFPTQKQAIRHQQKKSREQASKKASASEPSGRSAKPGPRPKTSATRTANRRSNSAL
jgi:hypothetical protein